MSQSAFGIFGYTWFPFNLVLVILQDVTISLWHLWFHLVSIYLLVIHQDFTFGIFGYTWFYLDLEFSDSKKYFVIKTLCMNSQIMTGARNSI
jgi:hypothetical protein